MSAPVEVLSRLGEGEEAHAERPIGLMPEDLPKGLKAKLRTARKR